MDALPNLYSSGIIKVGKVRHVAHADEKGNEYKFTVGDRREEATYTTLSLMG
jgi:hypothetical protein